MIHKFSMNGYNIVLDVNGGAVHVLDDVAYDLLDFYKEKSKEEILEILKSKYQEEKINEAYEEILNLEKKVFYTQKIHINIIQALYIESL